MPDIDMDFEDARRGEVIEYVTQKYGKDHVDSTMKAWGQVSKGVQAIATETADYSKKSFEQTAAAAESPTERPDRLTSRWSSRPASRCSAMSRTA